MLDEVVQLQTGWLAHATHGINAIAQALPRARLGSLVPDPAPPLVAVVCDSNDAGVAARLETASEYAIVVWGDSVAPITVTGQRGTTKEVIVAAAFITKSDVAALQAIAQCKYFMRAGAISMERYLSAKFSADAEGYRELNGVRVLSVTSVKEQRLTATAKAAKRRMWGFLEIRSIAVETYH